MSIGQLTTQDTAEDESHPSRPAIELKQIEPLSICLRLSDGSGAAGAIQCGVTTTTEGCFYVDASQTHSHLTPSLRHVCMAYSSWSSSEEGSTYQDTIIKAPSYVDILFYGVL